MIRWGVLSTAKIGRACYSSIIEAEGAVLTAIASRNGHRAKIS